MKETNVLIPLAKGFEEIEAIAVIDVLRRAGISVLVHGVGELEVTGAHGITVRCDAILRETDPEELDMIVLPGGWGGTETLAKNSIVQELLKKMEANGKAIGAICAAPFALKQAGVLKKNYTCYPGTHERIDYPGYHPEKNVVEEGNLLTSRGPGTAICFGLAIVKKLRGEEAYHGLKKALLADYC